MHMPQPKRSQARIPKPTNPQPNNPKAVSQAPKSPAKIPKLKPRAKNPLGPQAPKNHLRTPRLLLPLSPPFWPTSLKHVLIEEIKDPIRHLGLEGIGGGGGLPFLLRRLLRRCRRLLSWCGGHGGDDGLCWLDSSFEGEGGDGGIGDELAVGDGEECRLGWGGNGGVGGGEGGWLL